MAYQTYAGAGIPQTRAAAPMMTTGGYATRVPMSTRVLQSPVQGAPMSASTLGVPVTYAQAPRTMAATVVGGRPAVQVAPTKRGAPVKEQPLACYSKRHRMRKNKLGREAQLTIEEAPVMVPAKANVQWPGLFEPRLLACGPGSQTGHVDEQGGLTCCAKPSEGKSAEIARSRPFGFPGLDTGDKLADEQGNSQAAVAGQADAWPFQAYDQFLEDQTLRKVMEAHDEQYSGSLEALADISCVHEGPAPLAGAAYALVLHRQNKDYIKSRFCTPGHGPSVHSSSTISQGDTRDDEQESTSASGRGLGRDHAESSDAERDQEKQERVGQEAKEAPGVSFREFEAVQSQLMTAREDAERAQLETLAARQEYAHYQLCAEESICALLKAKADTRHSSGSSTILEEQVMKRRRLSERMITVIAEEGASNTILCNRLLTVIAEEEV
jgi:hypothetical protein